MKTTILALIIMGLTSPMAFADSKINKYKAKIMQIDTNTANITALSSRVDGLPVGGGGGTTTPDPQTQTNTNALSSLNTQVQTNTGNISGNATNIQALSTRVDNIPVGGGGGTTVPDPQTQTNTGNISGNTAQIQGNTGNINSTSAEAQANTNTNATQATQIQANAAADAAQDTQIQTNTTSINGLTTSSTAMQGSVDGLSTQVSTIQSDLNVQGTQMQSNTDGVANNSARITALESGGTGGGGTTPPPPTTPAPTIDFTLYIPNAATKDFRFINNGACNTINQIITRVDDATGSDISINETMTGGLGNCTVFDTTFRLTATDYTIMTYKDSISNINFIYKESGGTMLNDSMDVGNTFGFALDTTNSQMSATILKNTILSIEPSITVPAGTFTNCLKMLSISTSSITNPSNLESVSWLCEGIGEVKRLSVGANNAMSIMELRAFTL